MKILSTCRLLNNFSFDVKSEPPGIFSVQGLGGDDEVSVQVERILSGLHPLKFKLREVGGGLGWGTHVNPWLIHVSV